MANVLKIKAGSGVPTTSDIVDREIAFNRSDNKLYINDSGTIVNLSGAQGGGAADEADRIVFDAQAGEALSKGDVVYISGISGNTPIVSKADADDANKMPSFGLASSSASLNNSVQIVTFGTLENLDTSAFTVGDTVFVSTTAGGLTATAPTGESGLIQNMGHIVRSHASTGAIKLVGAGRSAATPNLNEDKIFLGNSSNQSVSTALSSIGLSKFNNDSGFTTNTGDVSFNGSTANGLLTYGNSTTADVESDLSFDSSSNKLRIEDGELILSHSSLNQALSGRIRFNEYSDESSNVAGAYIQYNGASNYLQMFTNTESTDYEFLRALRGSHLLLQPSSGNVGIGTDSPQVNLDVTGSNGGDHALGLRAGDSSASSPNSSQIILSYNGNAYNSTGYAHSIRTRHNAGAEAGNSIQFWLWDQGTDTASTLGSKHVMSIEGNGRVGIGTQSPAYKLDVSGNARFTSDLRNEGRLLNSVGSAASPSYSFYSQGNAGMYRSGDGVGFSAAGSSVYDINSTRMYINTNVGIGTTSPSYLLHLSGTAPELAFTDTDGSATWRARAVTNNFHITETGAGNPFVIESGAGANAIRINSSGNVGIGTNSPTSKLHIFNGDGSIPDDANNHLLIEDDGHSYLGIGGGTSSDTGIHFMDSGGIRGRIAYHHNGDSMSFKTSNTERIRIDATGTKFSENFSATDDILHINPANGHNRTMELAGDAINVFFTGGTTSTTLKLNEDGGDVQMTATSKLYLDGGGDTYIHEPSGNEIGLVTGGNTRVLVQAHKTYINSTGANGLVINNDEGTTSNSGRIFFEGTSTSAIFQSGGALSFRTGATTGSSSGTQKFYIDTSGATVVGNLNVTGNSFMNYGLVVNEGGNDADFRVESVNNPNMLKVDASADAVLTEKLIDSATHIGTVGGHGLDGGTLSTTDWANFPVGYRAMIRNSNGTTYGSPVNNYGYFLKVANRDTAGGWGGIWVGYSTGENYLGRTSTSGSYASWEKIWTSGNDGSGSTLDADLLDGQHASAFLTTSGTAANSQLLDSIDSTGFTRKGVQSGTPNTASNRTTFTCNDAIETSNGNQSGLEVWQDTAGADAFMTFHVAGDYAGYFGLDGSTNDLSWGGWSNGNGNKYKVWHAGNDGSGSTLDADLLDGVQGTSFLRSDADDTASGQYTFTKVNDHAIRVGTIRGTTVGSQSGEHIHMYNKVHIGSPSGWGSRSAPTYGLSTYGGANLATDTGNVGIGTQSPSGKLGVEDTTGSLSSTKDITAEFKRADGTYNPRLQIRHSTTGTNIFHTYSTSASLLTFGNGGTPEAMAINSSGNVGIGVTSPTFSYASHGMEIAGSGNQSLRLEADGSTAFEISARTGDILLYNLGTARSIRFGVGGGEKFRINSDGNSYFYQSAIINTNNYSLSGRDAGGTVRTMLKIDTGNSILLGDNGLSGQVHMYPSTYTQINTNNGYLQIGPQNTSHCHYTTDRANHWFNQMIYVNGGVVSSYLSDLSLRRNGGSADRIDVTDSYTRVIVNDTEEFRVDGSGILTTGQTRTTDYFQVNKTSSTGSLLKLYNSGWSNATTHDIILNAYLTTLGDYTYLKSAGNSTNTHGIIVASDNYIFMGRDDLTTGGLDNSATAPITDTCFRLDGSGNGLFDGDVVAYSTTIASDARLKENVKDLNYGLKDVLDIRPVSFDWIDKRNGQHDIGVIAQEIEKIIPEVVVEVDTLNSEDTHKTVDYAKLTSVLIKAVQEQQQQINELKEKLNG